MANRGNVYILWSPVIFNKRFLEMTSDWTDSNGPNLNIEWTRCNKQGYLVPVMDHQMEDFLSTTRAVLIKDEVSTVDAIQLLSGIDGHPDMSAMVYLRAPGRWEFRPAHAFADAQAKYEVQIGYSPRA